MFSWRYNFFEIHIVNIVKNLGIILLNKLYVNPLNIYFDKIIIYNKYVISEIYKYNDYVLNNIFNKIIYIITKNLLLSNLFFYFFYFFIFKKIIFRNN